MTWPDIREEPVSLTAVFTFHTVFLTSLQINILEQTSLPESCVVCGGDANITCPTCRCVAWCTTEHQVADTKTHREWCPHIDQCQRVLDEMLEDLRQGNQAPATNSVGSSREHEETASWMEQVYQLLKLQSRVRHRAAVEEMVRSALLMLQLGGQGDPFRISRLILPLFLRIGQYQEFYDFVRWRMQSLALPDNANIYLGLRYTVDVLPNAQIGPYMVDFFEDIAIFGDRAWSLDLLLMLCLMKIKLYIELQDIDRLAELHLPALANYPAGVVDFLRYHCEIPEIRRNAALLESRHIRHLTLERLLDNIHELIDWIELREPLWLLWLAMTVRKGGAAEWDNLSDREHNQSSLLHFRMVYQAWAETPRAVSALLAIQLSREADENEKLVIPAL
ncbi:hypothetical protein N7539_004123 [Penicillium diatomitis]|uniref:MYND-type domain-containing protein n=1 Tax=Penicillium diatomitis TaxID=2819901 RepID=A0A9W9XE73_9EURO|nr:uncharacterized protein N7539_004123 [Penicillium diatomitis]KAJ5489233.1 hypothetical protein N7539_004123 [Penicillium diatomitis]